MIVYLGYIFIFFGIMAFLVSAIGLVRMPDVYTRMHVGTKTTTIGTILVIFGAICIEPSWALKLIILAIFILLTNPLSSSVIARASHKDGATLESDELKEIQK
ncbi:monovalent cation/H(+) antiporter subunit G [Sulfurovum sp. CS9]|uniref:monovalent cation/H(+) antiporter subunit G n=1 Tax=Sulfurovum sp. CS9 TaxID=3391146 RepID=UPI0039E8ABA1